MDQRKRECGLINNIIKAFCHCQRSFRMAASLTTSALVSHDEQRGLLQYSKGLDTLYGPLYPLPPVNSHPQPLCEICRKCWYSADASSVDAVHCWLVAAARGPLRHAAVPDNYWLQMKIKHFRWWNAFGDMCKMGWSIWSWFNVNRFTFDENMREKLFFTFSFPVTFTFDI